MIDSTYYLSGDEPTTPEPEQKQDHWDETKVVGSKRPRVDAYEEEHGVSLGVRPVRLTLTLPLIYLGRLDIRLSAGLRLLQVTLLPEGGELHVLESGDLVRSDDGALSTGTLFLGA